MICYKGIHIRLHCSRHLLYFSVAPALYDCFHDATGRALTPVDEALEIRPRNLSKTMIRYSCFVLHYIMLLPDNFLDTTMTALRVLVIFMVIIHKFMSDQHKSRPYTYTTVHAVSVKSLSMSVVCLLVGPTLNYRLNVFSPDMY